VGFQISGTDADKAVIDEVERSGMILPIPALLLAFPVSPACPHVQTDQRQRQKTAKHEAPVGADNADASRHLHVLVYDTAE
jgi:hypothetical protein